MKYKDFFIKTVAATLILSFFFTPIASLNAQAVTGTATAGGGSSSGSGAQATAGADAKVEVNSQVQGYLGGSDAPDIDVKAGVANVAADLLGCSAGAILAQIIAYGFNLLFKALTGVVSLLLTVPINLELDPTGRGLDLGTQAHTAQHIFGIPIGASLDAMAWCIINSIIEYVADATIAWANSGFEGSPAFLENPEAFFEGLADYEAGKFIQELAYNTTGINVCEPFRVEIALGLAESYGYANDFARQASCSIDQIAQNFANTGVYVEGPGGGTNAYQLGANPGYNNYNQQIQGFWTNWRNVSQYPENNVYGSYMMANRYMTAQIQRRQNVARFELGLNNGFLNFKKCEDPADPKSCKTYTPGSLIQTSLEKSLNLPKDRLVLAQKFDQVVTAIVNNLIKVALNKILSNTLE